MDIKLIKMFYMGEAFMNYLLVVIMGIVIGSFLNVCIFRVPNEESISYPPSHCSKCNHRLMSLDLIPIFSFAFLRGKCRYCKEEISFQYPIVESLNCILYIIIFLKYGISVTALKYCILISLLIVISFIDYKTQYVYRSTIIFGSICGFIFMLINFTLYRSGVLDSIAGSIIGFFIIKMIVIITKGMGDGDAEIAAVCGLFLGVKGILLGLFLSVIIGGASGILIIILKFKNLKDKIAFGPFIAVGAFISMMWAKEILEWYMKQIL